MPRKKKKIGSRTRARKRAVDIVFEADQKGFAEDSEALLDLLERRKTISPAQTPPNEFTQRLVEGVAHHIDDIDDQIIRFTHGRSLYRLPATERAILRIAVFEILFDDSVDAPVAIDEAVSLAKMIGGTDKSHNYVNAVLSAIDKARDQVSVSEVDDDIAEGLDHYMSGDIEPKDDMSEDAAAEDVLLEGAAAAPVPSKEAIPEDVAADDAAADDAAEDVQEKDSVEKSEDNEAS